MDTSARDDDGSKGGLVDMSGRRLRAPNFPRVTRQNPLQRHFLKRLQRLALLGRYGQEHLAFSETESILIKRATYSVYRDCAALGALWQARAIIKAASEPTDHNAD